MSVCLCEYACVFICIYMYVQICTCANVFVYVCVSRVDAGHLPRLFSILLLKCGLSLNLELTNSARLVVQ